MHDQYLDTLYDEKDVEEQNAEGFLITDSGSATSSEIMVVLDSLPRESDPLWIRRTRGTPEQAPAA